MVGGKPRTSRRSIERVVQNIGGTRSNGADERLLDFWPLDFGGDLLSLAAMFFFWVPIKLKLLKKDIQIVHNIYGESKRSFLPWLELGFWVSSVLPSKRPASWQAHLLLSVYAQLRS